MTICGCPEAVIYSLRSIVQAELDKVRAILRATSFFDRAIREVAGVLGEILDAALAAIPDPVVIDVSSILDYLTCPLLPLALGLDLVDIEDLDPGILLAKLKALKAAEIEDARQAYEAFLRAAEHAQLLFVASTYTRNLSRLRFDAASFAKAVLISATVLAVCGEEEYQAGPYEEFATVIQDFNMDNGVPSSLSDNAAAIVQKLLQIEQKFKALRVTII